MKRLTGILLSVMLMIGLFVSAGAEGTAADSLAGTWYVNQVMIGDTMWDVSESSVKTVMDFAADNTGFVYTAPDGEKKPFAWLEDKNGEIRYIETSGSEAVLKTVALDGDSLRISGGDDTYILGKTTPQGIDLAYGMYIECSCALPQAAAPDADYQALLDSTLEILRSRLKDSGVENAAVTCNEQGKICAVIPEVQDEALLDLFVSGGKLEFVDPDGNVFMTNEMIESAEYYYADGDHGIAFTLTEEGTKIFAEVTANSIGKVVAINLDGEQLLAPTVQSAIVSGSGVINGLGTAERAISIAAKIKELPMPLSLTLEKALLVTDVAHAEQEAAQERAQREDAAQVILKLGDTEVTKAEIQAETQNQMDYMAYLYSMYGYSFDTTDPENIAAAQEAAIASIKQDMALTAKAKELGLDVFSEEELAQVQQSAQSDYNSAVSYIRMYGLTDTEGKSAEELAQAAEDTLNNVYGITLDSYVANAAKTMINDKLYNYAIMDVKVTDEEVQAEYESRVSADREKYEGKAGSWTTASMNGNTLYYTPAGVRRVKQILTKFHDEDQTAIDDARQKATSANSAVYKAQSKVSDAQAILDNEESSGEDKAQAEADLAAAQQELEEAQKEFEAAKQEMETMTNKAFENLDEEADAILAALAEGADWQALMDEKNQDPGMTSFLQGYPVSADMTNFDPAFVEAAMALEKPGDVSTKVRGSSYGYYIIRYDSDEPEGPVAMEDVQESIRSELLSQKQSAAYEAATAQWLEEAGIEENLQALGN